LVAAIAGGLLGVGTYFAGQAAERRKERKGSDAALTLVLDELQNIRASLNTALNPKPPGANVQLEARTLATNPAFQIELAKRLPYADLITTMSLFHEFDDIGTRNLYDLNDDTKTRLLSKIHDVEHILQRMEGLR
jgi:hypothetical protein